MRIQTLLALALLGAAAPPSAETPAEAFFRKTIGLTDAQIAAVDRGDVITKQLATTEKADVAVFGAVRIPADPDAYMKQFRDIVAFRRTPSVIEIGRFSDPPNIKDVAGLSMDEGDFAAARQCKASDCDLKLARSAIDRMHAEIDWSAKDSKSRTTEVMRQMLVDFVATYRKGGRAELATYNDKDKPVDAALEFKRLLEASPYLIDHAPEFHAYVGAYPQASLAGVEDFFYWVKDKNAPKPTVSVFHVSMWKDPRGPVFIASKQIYASHYIRVGLDLTALIPTREGPKGFYLADLFRSRIDPPGGMIGGVVVSKIRGGIEGSIGDSLKAARAKTLAP